MSLASGAKTAIAEYRSTTGKWPINNAVAGLATTITGNYVDSVEIFNDEALMIVVAFSSDAHTKIANGRLVLTATDQGGSISWSCRSEHSSVVGGAPDITDYLPSSCKDSSTP